MIYVPKISGFSTKDLARKNDAKLFKKVIKGIDGVDNLSERASLRKRFAEKASDGRGITVDEMADIVADMRYGDGKDTVKESRQVADKFDIGERRLQKARNRRLALEDQERGIGRSKEKNNSFESAGKQDSSWGRRSTATPPTAHIPRRPMF